MNWLCWHVGTATDPKICRIADNLKIPRAFVIALWAMLLESAKERRGEYSIDPEDAAYALGCDVTFVTSILGAMKTRRMIDDGTIIHWRDRQHGTSAERTRKYRDKLKQHDTQDLVNITVTSRDARDVAVTPTIQDSTVQDSTLNTEINSETYARPEKPTEVVRLDFEFSEFYAAYPRKVGKGQARRAYGTARKKTDHASIMAGVRRYINDPTRKPEFTKHPSTWLNAECWADETTGRLNGGQENRSKVNGSAAGKQQMRGHMFENEPEFGGDHEQR